MNNVVPQFSRMGQSTNISRVTSNMSSGGLVTPRALPGSLVYKHEVAFSMDNIVSPGLQLHTVSKLAP